MAKKGSTKGAKKGSSKSEPTMTTGQAFKDFNPKGRMSWQDYCKSSTVTKGLGRRLGINETGTMIEPGSQKDVIASIDRHNAAFEAASERWEATPAYGRQHYNDDGFLHRAGLTRLDDDALAKLVVQAGEELCQRAALSSAEATKRDGKVDTARCAALVEGIGVWLAQRPKAIAGNKKAQAYSVVKADAEAGTGATLELKS